MIRLCSKKPVGQSGAVGLLSGDAVTCSLLGEIAAGLKSVVMSKEESLQRRRGKEEGNGQGQTAPFYPAEVMVTQRCRVEQG